MAGVCSRGIQGRRQFHYLVGGAGRFQRSPGHGGPTSWRMAMEKWLSEIEFRRWKSHEAAPCPPALRRAVRVGWAHWSARMVGWAVTRRGRGQAKSYCEALHSWLQISATGPRRARRSCCSAEGQFLADEEARPNEFGGWGEFQLREYLGEACAPRGGIISLSGELVAHSQCRSLPPKGRERNVSRWWRIHRYHSGRGWRPSSGGLLGPGQRRCRSGCRVFGRLH